MIRELQDEIAKLRAGGVNMIGGISGDLSKQEYERAKREMEESIRRQLEDSEKQMELLKESYEQRLAEAMKNVKLKFLF